MRTLWFVLSWAIFLSGCSDTLTSPIRQFDVLTPRPFGYVIGDVIRHKLVITTRSKVLLQQSSLPAPGAINRWLDLNEVVITETEVSGGHRYQIELNYQIFYAPLEVKMLTLPGFKIGFNQGGQSIEQTVPAWSFTASPLRELAVRKDGAGEYMRPDAPAMPTHNGAVVAGLSISMLTALLAAARLAYLYGMFPSLNRRDIFKKSLRSLNRLSAAEMTQALTTMHHALNDLNGRPLFKHGLDLFYRVRPDYAGLAADLEWFFNYSNRYFFAGKQQGDETALARLKTLCLRCREIERGSR